MKTPVLHTDRTELRFAGPEDVPGVVDYYTRNREHLRPWDPPHPEGFLTEQFWQKRTAQNEDEFYLGLSCRFFLFGRELPDRVIGHVSFTQIFRGPFHACYLGYSLDEAEQSKGLMFEALSAGIGYMFGEQNLHRIMANYIPYNRRSGNLLKRLGFIPEGYAQDYLMINGEWQDHILTSLTNRNWKG